MGDVDSFTVGDTSSDVYSSDQRPFATARRRIRHHASRVGAAAPATTLDVDTSDLAWQDSSSCVSVDPELFFPEGPVQPYVIALCRACPAMADCLQAALGDTRLSGIWGGTTAEERRRMRERARRSRT